MSDETVKLDGPTGTNGAIGVAGVQVEPQVTTNVPEPSDTVGDKPLELDSDLPATPDPNDAPIAPAEPQDQAAGHQSTTKVGANYPL